MVKNSCFRGPMVTVLLFSACIHSAGAQEVGKTANDEMLGMIPAESIFCVRINNLDKTLATVDQFAMGISPVPMGTSMVVRGQLAQILGSPDLKGVYMGGSFAFFGVLTEGEEAAEEMISALVPISDYELFISGNPNVGDADANGVSEIAKNYPLAIAARAGKYALIKSPNAYERLLGEVKATSAGNAGLATVLDACEAENAAQKPVWGYGNIQEVNKAFGPMVLGKFAEAKANMDGMEGLKDMSKVMDIYIAVLETLMKETKSLSIAVEPKPDILNFTETITAVRGTDMADLLAGDISGGKEFGLLGYMEDDAVMNFALRPNSPFMRQVNIKGVKFLRRLTGDMSLANSIKLKAILTDMSDALGDSAICSAAVDAKVKPPFAGSYVVEVRDVDKFNKVLGQTTEILEMSGISKFYNGLGINLEYSIKPGVDNYKDVSIDSARFAFNCADANSPEAKMLEAMYGDGFDYRWAMVDNLWVCAIGGDVNASVRKLIDEVKSGGPTQVGEETKAAMALIPGADRSEIMGTYNYVRVFGMMAAIMPMPVPMPAVDIETKSNIAFAGKVGDGKAVIDLAIPKQHLMEIVTVIKKMQEQMMQQMQQQQEIPMPDGPVTQ